MEDNKSIIDNIKEQIKYLKLEILEKMDILNELINCINDIRENSDFN